MTTGNKPLIAMGWLRALIYLLVTVFLVFATLAIRGMVTSGNAAGEVIENSGTSIAAFLVNYSTQVSIFLVGVALLFRKFADRQSIASMGFHWKGYQSQAAAGFFVALLILCSGSLVLVLLKYLFFTGLNIDASNLFYSLLLFIIVAFTEEIAFRGYILNNLMQSTNKWAALGLSSLAFALIHATNPGITVLALLNIFVAGFLLGINYIYTKNLWFAIFLHLSWNYFQGPVLGYEVSGFASAGFLTQTIKGPDLLTGGDFGFEGSLVCLVLNSVACILLARHYEAVLKKTMIVAAADQ